MSIPGPDTQPLPPYGNQAEALDACAAMAIMYSQGVTHETSVQTVMTISDVRPTTSFTRIEMGKIIGLESDNTTLMYVVNGLRTLGAIAETNKVKGASGRATSQFAATPMLGSISIGYGDWYLDTVADASGLQTEDILDRAGLAASEIYLLKGGLDPDEAVAQVAAAAKIGIPHASYRMISGFAYTYGVGLQVNNELKQAIKSHPLAAGGRRASLRKIKESE